MVEVLLILTILPLDIGEIFEALKKQ